MGRDLKQLEVEEDSEKLIREATKDDIEINDLDNCLG